MSDIEPEVTPMDFAQSVMNILDDSSDQETDTAVEAPAELEDNTTETETVTEGRARDPETGRFTKVEEEPAEEEIDESPVEEEEEEVEELEPSDDGEYELVIDDPAVEAFLAKYDGDLGKALKAATEAQSTIGRQGSELGELRKQLQERFDSIEQRLEQQPQAQPYVDWAGLIEDDPKQAAQTAMQYGNVEAMMAAVKEWANSGDSFDAFEASTFLNNVMRGYEMDQLRAELSQREAPAAPAAQTNDEVEVAKVLQRHPDLEKHLPAIGELARERPLLAHTLQNGSPQEKASALEDLYLIARSRGTDTSEAIKKIRVRTSEEGKRAKANAAVVSASRGSAASGNPPTKAESFLDEFDSYMRSKGLLADE